MLVYHGSTQIVDNPDVFHSTRNLDFGKGFYVTSVKEQAFRWAQRKQDIDNARGIVNYYELSDYSTFNVLNFGENLADWIDFVCACRSGSFEYKKYDLVIGKVADDRVFRVVNFYQDGIWDKERAISEIKAYPTYDQYAFISQEACDSILKFKKYEVL